ncbi:ester cyclase [Pseudonocardia sp. CA-107938]|uniref:ester cyclase n=1 Tax=Pseudonocardia sp. CA-107938 TaxID=3240021 RepID=UPI003D948753
MGSSRAGLEQMYRRYLDRCNEHRFAELGEFVAQHVEINGEVAGLERYGSGLQTVIDAIPDFHWDLQHLLVDGPWLAARLIDTGTTVDGRSIHLQEFAMYRTDGGRIAAVWGDLDPPHLPLWGPATG